MSEWHHMFLLWPPQQSLYVVECFLVQVQCYQCASRCRNLSPEPLKKLCVDSKCWCCQSQSGHYEFKGYSSTSDAIICMGG
jgi:hypothetical protein